ncbi:unnamed protein product [Dicrocoelium dendriticum]|nr:unnamed protein product [Dicrocoelium dendriticum]
MTYNRLSSTSVPCPTCRGTGNLPKDSVAEYVALIPLSDSRLRPRRTWLKIAAAVALCLTVFTLLLTFLFPRAIRLSSTEPKVYPSSSMIDDNLGTVDLDLTATVNLTNPNFVPVSVTEVLVSSKYHLLVLNEFTYRPNVTVSPRSTQAIDVPMRLHFTNQQSFIAIICKMPSPYIHEIYISFSFQMKCSLLWQPVEATINTMQLVNCYPTNTTATVPVM